MFTQTGDYGSEATLKQQAQKTTKNGVEQLPDLYIYSTESDLGILSAVLRFTSDMI